MPDRWGRPTFMDGLQIAQTVNYFKRENEREQDRVTEKEAYSVADAMANKQDISGFSPEARYRGAKMHWDTALGEIKTKTQEQILSNAGMQEKINKLKLNLEQAGEKLRSYKMARAAGNDELAKQIAVQLNNEHMYTGRYVEPGEKGYKVTNWDGKKEDFDDIPVEQVDQMIGAYFDKPTDEIMQWQMSAEQMRSQKNEEILSRAEPYINEKTGQIIYRIPAGLWGPDGKPRGAFFADGPMAQNEMPASQAKGFVKFGVAAGRSELKSRGLDISKKQKDLKKPDIISPSSIVTQGGKAGLIVGEGGEAGFQPVRGGLDIESVKEGGMNASQEFNLKVKQLETELMPFLDKGQSVIDPETLQITNDGRNALVSALKLVQKYQKDPNSVSEQEAALVQNAVRAVQMYQAISESNRQSFGLQNAPAQQTQQAPQKPDWRKYQ